MVSLAVVNTLFETLYSCLNKPSPPARPATPHPKKDSQVVILLHYFPMYFRTTNESSSLRNFILLKCSEVELTIAGHEGYQPFEHAISKCPCFLRHYRSYPDWPVTDVLLHYLAWQTMRACSQDITREWLYDRMIGALEENPLYKWADEPWFMRLEDLALEVLIGSSTVVEAILEKAGVGQYIKDRQQAFRFVETCIEKYITNQLFIYKF